ncbi:MAG: polysaccharide biosynthesis/export family protein [Planctomycetes bacterium]|nr:polysaccharide biosynthesis/export family protein [Planctomycetota bacterium]
MSVLLFLRLRACARIFALPAIVLLSGCIETDSFFDPSKTGYFETTPSEMPILTRIDVIEQASDGPEFVSPTPADLKASDLSYRFAPGDVLRIEIPSLMATGQTEQAERVVDQTGDIQLPVINKVRAAGLTTEELQTSIELRLKGILTNPQAFVALQEGRAFQFRILGSVDQPGLYALNKPDLRLLDAIATARGASVNTVRILITREVIANEYRASYDQRALSPSGTTAAPATTAPPTTTPTTTAPPKVTTPSEVDIDQLINELPGNNAPASSAPAAPATPAAIPPATDPAHDPAAPPAAPPSSEPAKAPALDPAAPPKADPATDPAMDPAPPTDPAKEPAPSTDPSKRRTQLGMLRAETRQAPPVDIDQLEPAKSDDRGNQPPVQNPLDANAGDQFIFDNASQSWIRKSSLAAGANHPDAAPGAPETAAAQDPKGTADVVAAEPGSAGLRSAEAAQIRKNKRILAAQEKTVVIDIDYNQLVRGESKLNIVIRPGDLIYCDSGQVGVVYIDGEINRPGVYNLPTSGKLTLSRLVAAAGGVSELAIPERCDLIRRLGSDKEACVRISLAAIRNRGEPDIFLKPDDHIIVGTDFWAWPLARFRRDFSMPNSIGFQLDRNFGNDVFGAPPSNIGNQ